MQSFGGLTRSVAVQYQTYKYIDIQQLVDDIYVQNWSPIYVTSNPETQIQHFNSILLLLLDAHVPLREYIMKNVINSWYNYDTERTMVERNIAYRVWRKLPADRKRYVYLVLSAGNLRLHTLYAMFLSTFAHFINL
jgi:hypothetical protein